MDKKLQTGKAALLAGAMAASSAQGGDLNHMEGRLERQLHNSSINAPTQNQYAQYNNSSPLHNEPTSYVGITASFSFGSGSDLGDNYSISANFGSTQGGNTYRHSLPIVQAREGEMNMPLNNLTRNQQLAIGAVTVLGAVGVYALANDDTSSNDDSSSSNDSSNNDDGDSGDDGSSGDGNI